MSQLFHQGWEILTTPLIVASIIFIFHVQAPCGELRGEGREGGLGRGVDVFHLITNINSSVSSDSSCGDRSEEVLQLVSYS